MNAFELVRWGTVTAIGLIAMLAISFASYFAGRFVGRAGGGTGKIWIFFLLQMAIAVILAEIGWFGIACA